MTQLCDVTLDMMMFAEMKFILKSDVKTNLVLAEMTLSGVLLY